MVEVGEFGVGVDTVKRGVVSLVSLVFPDVYCSSQSANHRRNLDREEHTERITIANFRSPAPDQVDMICLCTGHFWIPPTNQVHILVHFVRLDCMKDNTVHILPSSQYLTEALLNVLVHLASFMGSIYQIAQRPFSLGALLFGRGFACLPYIMG